MRYSVKYKKSAEKKLNKLDPPVREKIKKWVEKNLEGCENPRHTGKSLDGDWYGYWRYRVGNYRLVAQIVDSEIIIFIVNVDKGNDIYK